MVVISIAGQATERERVAQAEEIRVSRGRDRAPLSRRPNGAGKAPSGPHGGAPPLAVAARSCHRRTSVANDAYGGLRAVAQAGAHGLQRVFTGHLWTVLDHPGRGPKLDGSVRSSTGGLCTAPDWGLRRLGRPAFGRSRLRSYFRAVAAPRPVNGQSG